MWAPQAVERADDSPDAQNPGVNFGRQIFLCVSETYIIKHRERERDREREKERREKRERKKERERERKKERKREKKRERAREKTQKS